MGGGGFVFKEGNRLPMKPYAAPTSTTYLPGSVMVRSSSGVVVVSTTETDTALSILLGGSQPYGNNDYCSTSDALLEVAVDGIVWVRSADAQTYTWMLPVFNGATGGEDGVVDDSDPTAGVIVGFYICDKDGNVGADRLTTSAGEMIGVLLQIYTEVT